MKDNRLKGISDEKIINKDVINEEAIPFSKRGTENLEKLYSIYINPDEWIVRFNEKTQEEIRIPSKFISEEVKFSATIAIATRIYLLASIGNYRKEISSAWEESCKKNPRKNSTTDAKEEGNRNYFTKFATWLKSKLSIIFAISLITPIASCIYCIWKPLNKPIIEKISPHLPEIPLHQGLLFSFAPLAAIISIAFYNSFKKSRVDNIIEEFASKAKKIQSEINQINTKVAGCYVSIDGKSPDFTKNDWHVPESFLRLVDEKLRIKESIESINKVLDLQALTASHKEDKEHRLHLSKSITAAGSGIFTGFFTYEAGESVLKYIHTVTNADDRTLQYWIYTKAGVAATKVENLDFSTAVGDHTKAHTEAHTISTTAGLDKAYHENFAHHEMVGQAWLLTATIIFTFLAMCISYIKPHESSHEGHGHH